MRKVSRIRYVSASLAFIGITITAATNIALAQLSDSQVTHAVAPAAIATEANSPTSPVKHIVVAPLPTETNGFLRKASTETPSGFEVPRFVSLKFGTVNGRTGPSRDHAIAWQYQRRGLPLVVVAETEMWRKVRDINGDEAWVRKPALSGERFIITMSETLLLSKPKLGARPVASSDGGALMKLEECNTDGWCRVKAGNGIIGWTSKRNLWGAQPL